MSENDRQCPACGETAHLTRTAAETGRKMTREVWFCETCGKTWQHWVEIKHQPFPRE